MDSKITTYAEATQWLFSQLPMFSRTGGAAYKPGLERVERLDKIFCHPHRKYATIHVGGTNGKGSVSHLISSALMEKGLRVGLYTSPHLVDFRERIKVNGEMIPQQAVVDFTNKIKGMQIEDRPSFFEITMMLAFDWFARAGVDVAVIEVGMGGRLDSTNIITPLLSVITNISKDHTQFLGSTLKEIAVEKAGIIKQGVGCVIGERQEEIEGVFIDKGISCNVKPEFASDYGSMLALNLTPDGWEASISSEGKTLIPLGGEYQRHNIATSYCALQNLPNEFRPTPNEIAKGFENVVKNTSFMGRWTILKHEPLVIADTGHNEAGLRYNISQLKMLAKGGRKLRFVIGFVADKDVKHILDLFPKDGIYYFTQAQIPRALKANILKEEAATHGLHGRAYKDEKDAYSECIKETSKEDIIYIGGSTFIVADHLAG